MQTAAAAHGKTEQSITSLCEKVGISFTFDTVPNLCRLQTVSPCYNKFKSVIAFVDSRTRGQKEPFNFYKMLVS